MATYSEIQAWVKKKYGWTPKSCWIAHCKELNGLSVRKSHRRKGERIEPCPESKRSAIEAAFRYFEMMK